MLFLMVEVKKKGGFVRFVCLFVGFISWSTIFYFWFVSGSKGMGRSVSLVCWYVGFMLWSCGLYNYFSIGIFIGHQWVKALFWVDLWGLRLDLLFLIVDLYMHAYNFYMQWNLWYFLLTPFLSFLQCANIFYAQNK